MKGFLVLSALCVAFAISQVKAEAVKRQALSGDYAQLAATVQRMDAQLQAQEQEIAQLKAAVGIKVAFTASCPEGTKFYSHSTDSIIPFDVLISNVGFAFSTSSHVFTAPYDGVYFFIITADVSADYEIIAVRRNDHLIFYADKDEFTTTHVSGSAVVTLRTGDVISANHVSADRGFVECGYDTTFSGFLIHY